MHDLNNIYATTSQTLELLEKEKNGGDALLLYFKYARQSRMQNTSNTYSKNEFMIKGLPFGKDRFQTAKNILKKLGLIEQVSRKDENGKFCGEYVKVNYVVGEEKTKRSVELNHRPTVFHSDGETATNALLEKVKCLEKKIKILQGDKKISGSSKAQNKSIKDFGFSDEVLEAIKQYDEVRPKNAKINGMKELGLEGFVRDLKKFGGNTDKGMIAVLQQSIVNGWRGIFELKNKPQKELEDYTIDELWDEYIRAGKNWDKYEAKIGAGSARRLCVLLKKERYEVGRQRQNE